MHSSPGNEGIIYALSWAPGEILFLYYCVDIMTYIIVNYNGRPCALISFIGLEVALFWEHAHLHCTMMMINGYL